jgi:arylsulfatase A-like enzyme
LVGRDAKLSSSRPTLLELVGVDVPAGIQGQSFAHVLTGTDRHREHALGRDKLTPTRYSLRTAELTLIHDIKDSSTGLYQRGSDPAELDDVADARPEDVERLKESLLARLAAIQEQRGALQASTRGESDVLTEDEQEKLRAIGYLR